MIMIVGVTPLRQVENQEHQFLLIPTLSKQMHFDSYIKKIRNDSKHLFRGTTLSGYFFSVGNI